jgi:hypothetical protein
MPGSNQPNATIITEGLPEGVSMIRRPPIGSGPDVPVPQSGDAGEAAVLAPTGALIPVSATATEVEASGPPAVAELRGEAPVAKHVRSSLVPPDFGAIGEFVTSESPAGMGLRPSPFRPEPAPCGSVFLSQVKAGGPFGAMTLAQMGIMLQPAPPAEGLCRCVGITLAVIRNNQVQVADPGDVEDAFIRIDERDADDHLRLTIRLEGQGRLVYEVRIYNDSRPAAASLEFVFSATQSGIREEVGSKATLKSIREKAAKERPRNAKIYEYSKPRARGLITSTDCGSNPVYDMKLDKRPGFPAAKGDILRVQVYVAGKLCGERVVHVTGLNAPVSGVDGEIIEADNAKDALKEALGKLPISAYTTADCPECRAIHFTRAEIMAEDWRTAFLEFRNRVRELVDEGEVRSDRQGRYIVEWSSGKGIVPDWKDGDGRLRVYVGVRPDPGDNRAVEIDVPPQGECPPPQIAVAVGNDGTVGNDVAKRGANATATAPWTWFALAMGGNGYTYWRPGSEDSESLQGMGGKGNPNEGKTLKGPDTPIPKGLKESGGAGGNAQATAGSCLAIGGNGGNGASGGNAGSAQVQDGRAPRCCAGANTGVGIGGHGGNGCNGNGGNGGDAVALDDNTPGFRDCPTIKQAFGGHGGFGIHGTGGNGGSVTIRNAVPSDELPTKKAREDALRAAGGTGGYGSNQGGRGGDATWDPPASGRKSRGNAGSGGNSAGTPGPMGTRNPAETDKDSEYELPESMAGRTRNRQQEKAYSCA